MNHKNSESPNPDNYIREKQKAFETKLEADYWEQSNDPEWQKEIELWDCTASDGLDDVDDISWEQLEAEKIAAREELNKLPPEVAQEKADILQARLWKPDLENHNPLGCYWDFEDE